MVKSCKGEKMKKICIGETEKHQIWTRSTVKKKQGLKLCKKFTNFLTFIGPSAL